MTYDSIDELLERINAIRDQTDLDLLLFCFRHANALLTVEQLAAAVGHDSPRVEASLHALIGSGLVERRQNPTVPAHIFAFRPAQDGPVASLLQMASTRPGRLALLQTLEQRAPHKRKA
jgi:hypothetical protein